MSAPMHEATSTHQDISVRYSNLASQSCSRYTEVGTEIRHEMMTSTTKSFDSILHRLLTDAPITLRTPISFVRCSVTKEARPNSPRQLMRIASVANTDASFPTRSSALNFF